jgi:hypothetical protein
MPPQSWRRKIIKNKENETEIDSRQTEVLEDLDSQTGVFFLRRGQCWK